MYCENCRTVFEGERCPVCGSKKIAEPQPDDVCYLTEVDSVWRGMLEDVLKQEGIESWSTSNIGAGLAVISGTMFERIRFYVRYEDLPKAAEIVEGLFSAPAETGEES